MARLLARRRLGVAVAGVVAATAATATASFGLAAASGPGNSSLPTITGTPQQAQALQASTGVWTGTGAIAYAYQWRRCDTAGTSCSNIGGETAASHVVSSADVGDTLRVVVTATDSTGSTSATSAQSAVVITAAPVSDQPPTIGGTPAVDQTLTVSEGRFTGVAPFAFTYGWQRCDLTGGACAAIPGAVAKTYRLLAADASRTIRAQVTATNANGATTATTVPTAAVTVTTPASATQLPSGEVSVAAGDVALPARLLIDGAEFTPNPVRTRTQPITLRVHVSDTRGYVIREARVFALGVPYSRVSTPPEGVTGADGWVTLRLDAREALPLMRGGYLVVFLRARVEGDRLIGGATAHRLVQLRTGPPA